MTLRKNRSKRRSTDSRKKTSISSWLPQSASDNQDLDQFFDQGYPTKKKKPEKPPFKIKLIEPLTPAQQDTFEAWDEDYNLCLTGMPGTGKSFLALYLGLTGGTGRIRIIRSIVSSRDIGFLPGSAAQKAAVYEGPYQASCAKLYGRADAWDVLKQKGLVTFETSSFLRGLTFEDETIIVDECQNMTYQELKTIITRVGDNSRIIFCGDMGQNDLTQKKNDISGWIEFEKVLSRMDEFDFITFKGEDIVRSGLVKSFILAEDNGNVRTASELL